MSVITLSIKISIEQNNINSNNNKIRDIIIEAIDESSHIIKASCATSNKFPVLESSTMQRQNVDLITNPNTSNIYQDLEVFTTRFPTEFQRNKNLAKSLSMKQLRMVPVRHTKRPMS